MRALVDGQQGGAIDLFVGADRSLVVMVVNDDGTLLNVTGDTMKFEFWDTADRKNAAILSVTMTLTTAASGLCAAAITDVQAGGTLLPGRQYTATVKRDAGGAGAFTVAKDFFTINVR